MKQAPEPSGCCDAADMVPWNLIDLDEALRASWAAGTCSPDDLARAGWQPSNPAWGHCDITALIVNDIFGGDLVVGEVRLNGEQHAFHRWNRLSTGVELDLAREQFQRGQTVIAARAVTIPPGRAASTTGGVPPPARPLRYPATSWLGNASGVPVLV